jgi:hypothetical protein
MDNGFRLPSSSTGPGPTAITCNIQNRAERLLSYLTKTTEAKNVKASTGIHLKQVYTKLASII